MTLLSRLSVLAAKVEATPGSAETLAAADAAFNIMDAEMNANIDVSTRPIQGSFRKLPGVPGMRTATCTFSLELIGDGSGGVPTWATTFDDVLVSVWPCQHGRRFDPAKRKPWSQCQDIDHRALRGRATQATRQGDAS